MVIPSRRPSSTSLVNSNELFGIIILCVGTTTGEWEVSEEKSVFLANKIIDAQDANQLVGNHWR